MRWRWWWKAWAVVGFVAQMLALKVGTPLTLVARKYVLASPWGSMIVGAFLTWLPYHWLLVVDGHGPGDAVAVLVGAAIGGLGWHARNPPVGAWGQAPEGLKWTTNPNNGGSMIEKLRFLRSWLWEELRDLITTFWTERGRQLLARAAEEVRTIDARTDLTGDQKRELVTERLRAFASGFWPGIRTQVIHDAIQIALRRLRGTESEEAGAA